MFINKFEIAVSGYYISDLQQVKKLKDFKKYYDELEDIKKTINLIKKPNIILGLFYIIFKISLILSTS
jgi:uncharacterized membrane protein